ncbi:MAG: ubiquitin-like domain-containing protein [Clostridia bacterium]|nr:ubiquitin-like domain-containing protein [Clostridia bacterium]
MESSTEGVQGSKLIKALIITLIVVTLISAFIIITLKNAKKEVEVVDNGQSIQVTTTEKTVEDLIGSLDIELKPGDRVVPSMSTELEDSTRVQIIRAKEVEITADGETFKIYSTEDTVSETLKQANVELSDMDKVNMALDARVYNGCNIQVVRVTQEELKDHESIGYKVVVKKNTSMDKGDTKVIQKGEEGKLERRYLVTYEDGVAVDRELISEQVVAKPVDRIVEEGTIETFYTSRGEKVRYDRSITMVATAYTAGKESTGKSSGDSGYGRTSTGMRVRHGVVAVDPRVIRLGTRLYISGYGFAIAADTGGAIKGNRIDLYMDSLSKARSFGRKKVEVYILR